ncbi:MAG: hypothetical protein A3F70_09885 [Acidobacteria bacterium RIFCSPLOWO2_12_FULL_67_14]|nr:MAG: hypothetical protein A3H29_00095 [Acidobacteria bacterium RIFCSPLOWO2_02_FULL_67_21]OFW38061.1 MAG: hypothetical protein A3F70_09885 [Acidobacteria bacterium RIFCSPLOWO2_12_FULL_67_14]
MTARRPTRCSIGLGLALVATIVVRPAAHQSPVAASHAAVATTVRITSPLGRTGLGGRLRLVARVQTPSNASDESDAIRVRFLVDGVLVGTVENGPPYAVEWTDENPFEAREIVAEADDPSGAVVRDRVVLPPFEIVDLTEVRRILLDAGVYDERDRPVSTLTAGAFTVRENDVVQPIDVAARETMPTTVVLLVDNSESMSRRIADVRRAAKRFGQTLRKGDRVIIAPFNARIGAITGPTDDPETVADAIGAMRAGGGTAILDGIIEGVRLLEGVQGRRAIILITDGFDENSKADVGTALTRTQAAGITVYAVGIGGVAGITLPGERLLRDLTGRTGGRVYFPWRDSELTAIAHAVAADSDSRYLITYTPINQKRDGTWRVISVDAGAGLRVRTRAGYRAPAPPPIRPTIEFSIANASRESLEVSPDDFEVVENGVVQTVDTFQEAVEPVSIVLTLDASGSMRRAAADVRRTAADFVAAVRPEDSLSLIMFADQPTLAHPLTTQRQRSLDAIAKYEPVGGTALYDAAWTSLEQLKDVPGRHAIVILSDGRDENNAGTAAGSVHALSEVMELTRRVGAAVFTIGLGSRVDQAALTRLSQESGGETYLSLDAAELSTQFQLVVDNLRRRYRVGYTSTNSENDGQWRQVEIRPRREALAVAAQRGYFAPEP